jgi:hypothetical protein
VDYSPHILKQDLSIILESCKVYDRERRKWPPHNTGRV